MITPSYLSLCLKLMGVIFILSFLVDTATSIFPFTWGESSWQISVVTALVERGVVPLLGMALILIGYWVDTSSGNVKKASDLDLRLPVYIIASFLGLMFLLLVPVHLNNLNQYKITKLEQIEQQQQEVQRYLDLLNKISKNPQQVEQEIKQRQQSFNPLQIQQLQSLIGLAQQKPEEFNKEIERQKNQLTNQQREAEGQTKTQALKQGLRTGLSSLMLAIVYSAVGWLGLLGLKNSQPNLKS
jgi:ABC-type multidrug transport system fused ATPase/permease subunit